MIGKIVPLAVLAAVAPTTLTAVLVLLGGPRPIRMLVALYGGGMLASVAIGYGVVSGLERSGALHGHAHRHVSPGIDLALGGLALLLAWWLASGWAARRKQRRAARKVDSARRDPWSHRMLGRGSTPLIFAIGVVLNLPGGLYLVAVKDIAVSHPSHLAALGALIAFNLVMLTPIELPLVASLADPEGTRVRLQRLSAWLGRHGRQLATGVALIAGLYLVVRGAIGL